MFTVEYWALAIERSARVSIRFCSFLPRTCSSKLFIDSEIFLAEVVRKVYPNFVINEAKASSFSMLGVS